MFPDVTTFAGTRFMAVNFNRMNPLTEATIGAAIKVHRALGPGLLESAYQACLAFELRRSGMSIRSNVSLPVDYDGVRIEAGYRIDLVVDETVILEIKSVKKFADIHTAQVLTYLKLSGYPVGLLMNFNVTLLKSGLKRLINPHPAAKFLKDNPEDGGRKEPGRTDEETR
jgi:GxxExxY protein